MHDEAERLEHAVSDVLIERMAAALGNPRFDPHGDPIPDQNGAIDELVYTPLAEIPTGETAEIRRVDTGQAERLRYLEHSGLTPGYQGHRHPSTSPSAVPSRSSTAGQEQVIGHELAQQVLCVRPEPDERRAHCTRILPADRSAGRGAAAGWRRPRTRPSLPESYQTVKVPKGVGFFRKALAFAGPGYMVAVGYMDPGNWATDLAGGSRFGYTLLSVILISNLMAILLQSLAVKLGVVTGRDLAQACRDHYSKPVSYALWVLCEIAIAACDLAEVIGSAIALNLLFGIPLLWGVCMTAAMYC